MSMMLSPKFDPKRHVNNVAQLCGLFLIERPAQVPVAAFRVTSDGKKQEFVVETAARTWRHCPIALVLLLFMDRVGHPQYSLTPEMRTELCDYAGAEAVFQATQFDAEDQALRALLGDEVQVELVLRPGYSEHLATRRSAREVIGHAWQRRESLTAHSPEPFLRQAIAMMLDHVANHPADGAKGGQYATAYQQASELQRRLQSELATA